MGREEKIFDSFDALRISQSKLPKLIFDFIEGATGREIAVNENVSSFDEVKLLPRALIDVSERSQSISFLGEKFCSPFGIAPMGMCNLAYPKADILMANIAKERNFPHCIATATSTNLEEVYCAGEDNSWFQLYVLNGPERGLELAKIAQSIGYKTLILTVDVPAFDINKKFGSLKGTINYNGTMDIVIKLTDNDTKKEYFTSTNDRSFLFSKVPQGKYLLESYEKKHFLNETYYSGVWNPFEEAAQVIRYPDLIDIRAHWEVEGIEINF